MYSGVCYYVVAHQDDWQLFYGQQAFSDLQEPNSRVVFIYTTAGDAGEPPQWWRARERGAVAAQVLPGGGAAPNADRAVINGHPITIYDAGRFISYHMRLPDGNVTGDGFPSTRHASLRKLQSGEISGIGAVDGSTTYHGWDDFCATLHAIIEREGWDGNTWLNAADWSWTCSPEDHSDHKATGDAVKEIIGNRLNRLWFVTYSTSSRPANLIDGQRARKASVFWAYAQVVVPLCGADLPFSEWCKWGAKDYHRRLLAGEEDFC
jgi:hypothetical protein